MSEGVEVHLSFDDHDSPRGGCTTHFAALFTYILLKKTSIHPVFLDYPLLVRLNPAVPWKTRGNGAVVLRLRVPLGKELELAELAETTSSEYAEAFTHRTSKPGTVILVGGGADRLRPLYRRAVADVLTVDVARRYAEKAGARIISAGDSRGVVGAAASLGGLLQGEDYTYELLAYRSPEFWGEPRRVGEGSVRLMARLTQPLTFYNYDFSRGRVLVAPHGPDPVLLGIRGEYPWVLRASLGMLDIGEPIDAWMIYRSNQATDAHCVYRRIEELRPYQSACVEAVVQGKPRIVRGGHVCFEVGDGTGVHQACVYEPTRPLTSIAGELWVGDRVRLLGTIRPPSGSEPQTINVEKIEVVSLARKIVYRNPRCPRCGHTMKSAGRGKGFKCPRCGYRAPHASKIAVALPRRLKAGVYAAPPSAAGHLMKPLSRMGREKTRLPGPPSSWFHFS